jgi:hypothetical protein
VRAFVAVFLTAFVVSGVVGIEAWPLTGWRLFSRLRTADQTSWTAAAVDGHGVERPVPFAELPRGYRGSLHVLAGIPALSPVRREAVCRAWALALRQRGADVVAVRIYQTQARLALGRRGSSTVSRQLRYTCAEGSPS